MSTLKLEMISFHGFVERYIGDSINHFSHDFEFGRSYMLNAELGNGAWALSWIIGGLLQPESYGSITKDGNPYDRDSRLKDAWFVRKSEYMGFRSAHRSVKVHIQRGLKQNQNPYLQTEQEIIARFRLTPQRYERPVRQLSHEGWRASCAIGLAHGKKIFCFPYIEYLRPYLIEDYFDLWLKDMVDLLRESGALVIVPAIATVLSEDLCDEIIHIRLRRPFARVGKSFRV
jgi:hypothetical protein